MKLSVLLEKNAYRLRGNSDNLEQDIRLVTADPTLAGEGVLLVCTQTALRDGHTGAHAAYTAGCRAFISDRVAELPEDAAWITVSDPEALLSPLAAEALGHPAREMTVIGISGTAGKSAVAHMLVAMLRAEGRRVAALTTDGVQIGDSFRRTADVVPDGAAMQVLLAEFRQAGAEVVILELSAYMLAHKTAFSIPFAAVLLTNLETAHIGYGEFESVDDYRKAKRSLLTLGAPFAVLPADLAKREPYRGRVITFGESGSVFAENEEPFADRTGLGSSFTLCLPNGEKYAVSLPVPGDFAVENALAATALGITLGLDGACMAQVLSACRPTGRLECVAAFGGRYVLTDAAFEADTLARSLDALRPYVKGRLAVLIGSVGGRARWRRAPLALAATTHADFAYFTADDPNGEDAASICAEMTDACDPDRCCTVPDRRRAILRAVAEMRPGDVLLIAGKGGCNDQLIGGVRLPFCEKEIVAEAVAHL